jgi:hypothetical protein
MQQRSPLARWLWLALAAGIVAAAALVARDQISRWTRHALRDQYAARIAKLPEVQATVLVHQLAALDGDAPAVLIPLLADPRDDVARAAEQTLVQLVDQWQHLPGEQSAPPLARLARELAMTAPSLTETRRRAAHDLAARLLVCSLDPQNVSAAQIVADCESVLRLQHTRASEIRVAAAPAPLAPLPAPVIAPPAQPIPVPAVEEPLLPAEPKFYGTPLEPERLIDASRERAEEPRQLRPPRATKIEG